MAELIWTAPMKYYSRSDEASFFTWLQSIACVKKIEGHGRELVVTLSSSRLSEKNLREFIALYKRYEGNLSELAQFANEVNRKWFQDPSANWYKGVFGK